MTIYNIDFRNDTPRTWTLCVYQTLPDSAGLDSVSWKQSAAAQGGETGVQWEINYMACLANYKQMQGKGVYKSAQKLETELGKEWDIVYDQNVQQLQSKGSTTPGQLLISNNSGALANPGIGMDGDIALVKRDVYSNNSAQFVVKPTYWVALYTDLTKGEVISGNQVHGPLKVQFTGGKTGLTYIARLEGENFIFEEEGGSARVEAPMSEMNERIEKLEYFRSEAA